MIQTQVFSVIGSKAYEFTCSSSASEAYTVPTDGPNVRITCEGPDDAFIVWGTSTAGLTCTVPTANTSGGTPANPGAMRIKAGAIEIFSIPGSAFAIRTAAGDSSAISMTFSPGI